MNSGFFFPTHMLLLAPPSMLLIKELISLQRMFSIRLMPMELAGFITYLHNSEEAAKKMEWLTEN